MGGPGFAAIPVHALLWRSYDAPVPVMLPADSPPKTIIFPLIKTAEWCSRGVGAPALSRATQVFVDGSNEAPSFSALAAPTPPHTTIFFEDSSHTAVWWRRPLGALVRLVAV